MTSTPFGALLKAHRTAAGLSQFKLAIRAGVSQHLISEYENGHCTPRHKNAMAIVAVFNLEPDQVSELLVAAGLDDALAVVTKERDRLLDTVDQLREKLAESQQGHRNAAQRAQTAEAAVRDLKRQIVALRGSGERTEAIPDAQPATAEPEPEPPSLVFLLGTYPEIRRAYALVESLYSAPDGQYAAVGNRVLAMFSEICEKADPWRKGKRDAA